MKRKESAKKKEIEEVGIYLLVEPEIEEGLIQNLIFPLMEKAFPDVLFAVVVIEDGDELKDLARDHPPKAFLFDAQRNFLWNKNKYSARNLLLRLLSRFPGTKGLLVSDEEISGPRSRYFPNCYFDQQETELFLLKKIEGKGLCDEAGVEMLFRFCFADTP